MQKIIIGLLTVCTLSSFAQGTSKPKSLLKNQYGVNQAWFEGSCMLDDGTELTGVLRYNDKTGVLGYDNGAESRTFTAKSVVGFEFFDEQAQQQRVFYSFPYPDKKGINRIYFFEVLFDFGDFAVLSKLDRLQVDQVNRFYGGQAMTNVGPPIVPNTYSVLEFSQTETIFFMNRSGRLDPYLNITKKETDELFFDQYRTKNKLIDKELFERYTGDKWSQLTEHAKNKDLHFHRRKDLIALLNYYKLIR